MQFGNIMQKSYGMGNKRIYELAGYSFLAFLIPLTLGHLGGVPNQFIVGTLVNLILFSSAVRVSGWKNLFPIALPSIGAYLTGFVFGLDTHFLLYLIPAIWIGNLVYVLSVKHYFISVKNTFLAVFASSAVKAFAIFMCAATLFYFNLIPNAILFAMGPMQFATAISGAMLGSAIFSKTE